MNSFKDFEIKPSADCFKGKKIEIDDILNKEIIVCAYKIQDSKFPKKVGDKCLHLQIKVDNDDRVVFTSGSLLMTTIKMIDQARFPFKTIIVKQNKRFEFT